VKGTQFTVKELQKAIDFLIEMIKKGIAPAERQNYADFQQPGGVPLLNVSTEHQDVQGFAELARQNDVNVSVKRNQESSTFYLCLQGQLNDIQKTVTEYQKRVREQQSQSRSTVTASLEQAKIQAAFHAKEAGKAHERERSGKEI
jgi:hypothetical protein